MYFSFSSSTSLLVHVFRLHFFSLVSPNSFSFFFQFSSFLLSWLHSLFFPFSSTLSSSRGTIAELCLSFLFRFLFYPTIFSSHTIFSSLSFIAVNFITYSFTVVIFFRVLFFFLFSCSFLLCFFVSTPFLPGFIPSFITLLD